MTVKFTPLADTNTEVIAIRQALTGIQVELIRIANALDTFLTAVGKTASRG